MTTSASGYWLQPGNDDEAAETLRSRHGVRPVEPLDPLDEGMPAASLRAILQIGAEHLAGLAGATTGDVITASMVNRGMVIYLQQREERLQAWLAGDGGVGSWPA